MNEARLTRRDRQAQETRAEILRAARRLFAERGYARTSVKDVAEAAGVSAQTVYDSIGSKRALVLQLNDLIDHEAGIPALAMSAAVETDPVALVATGARIARAILDHCSDIISGIRTGSVTEPELAAVVAEGELRHRGGAAMVAASLRAMGALRPELTVDEAADTLAALTDVSLAVLLRDHYGWSPDKVESWMIESCRTLLLP